MTDGPWDVILIGSGISSLTCALLLAKAGRKVLILERYEKPGGYLHCFERYGHRFDTGAHYVGAMAEGEPFHALLSYLGVYRDDLFVPLADDGFDVMQFRDFQVKMTRGYGRLVADLSEAFPDDAAAVRAFFDLMRRSALMFSTYNFARVDQDDDQIAGLLGTSLATAVQGLTSNPRLQSVFYAYCALHGVAPKDVSVGMHALLTDSLVRSAWGFKAGGERLVESYLEQLRRAGAEIRLNAPVIALESDGRRVTGVKLASGEVLTAKLVVSGIHPKATFRMLQDFKVKPAFTARLEGLEETVGFLGVYAVVKDQGLIDRDRNYYFFDWDDPEAFDQLSRRPGDPVPQAAFLCPASREAPLRQGAEALMPVSLHAPAPYEWFSPFGREGIRRRSRAYHEKKFAAVEQSLAFVERRMPGLRASVVQFDASTPLSNVWFNGSEQGSAYGIYHSIKNTGPRSLGPRTHVENLLLTGQSSLFPGLLGAAISGLRTAGNLIGIKNILRDLSPMVRL